MTLSLLKNEYIPLIKLYFTDILRGVKYMILVISDVHLGYELYNKLLLVNF